jgi:hypothetical protein
MTKHYDVLSSTGAASMPAIVVAFARFGQPGHDATLYSEIGAVITRSTVEVWGSGWSANLVGGQFPEGWVAAIEDHPLTDRLVGLPQPGYEDIFERIAQRFAGRGPVRVFWLNRRLGWFDARASPEHFVTRNRTLSHRSQIGFEKAQTSRSCGDRTARSERVIARVADQD